jgi:hypothetical protein
LEIPQEDYKMANPIVKIVPMPGLQGSTGATGATGATGPVLSPTETSYTVTGGSLGTAPTFSGSPMFYGSYVKIGPSVTFRINVEFDNITGFGTGQYYLTLPFTAKYGTEIRGGCLHDESTGYLYHISGHVNANSNQLLLYTTDVQGSTVRDYEFTSTEPVTLVVQDSFHIGGVYIATS